MKRRLLFILFIIFGSTLFVNAQITADILDQEIWVGGAKWVGQSTARVGTGGPGGADGALVIPFMLPTIPSGMEISSASFSINLSAIVPTDLTDGVLTVLDDVRSAAGVVSGDLTGSGTIIDASFVDNSMSAPSIVMNSTVALTNAIKAIYTMQGDFIFIRLKTDGTPGSLFKYYTFETANGTIKPTLTLTYATLPVALTSFTANTANKSTNLSWSTASEINNEGFQIQRSSDGKSWSDLGFVKGNDNSSRTIDYTYTDDLPSTGLNYYRLKQMDFDGKFDYSSVVSVNMEGERNIFNLYPNPTTDKINFDFSSTDEPLNVKIYNQLGVLVQNNTITEGVINIQSLPSGAYNISMTNKTINYSTKIVKK